MNGFLVSMALCACVLAARNISAAEEKPPTGKDRLFEMRTYFAAAGKMDGLHARFRDHTNKLFVKHGMSMVGYWVPLDKPNTLVYILAYPDKDSRDKSWKAFIADPDWVKAKNESEVNGKLVDKIEVVFLNPTDYSPIK